MIFLEQTGAHSSFSVMKSSLFIPFQAEERIAATDGS
jgi:hypothetical protein